YDRATERELALELAEKALRGMDRSEERLSDKDKAKIARKLAAAGFSAGATYDAIGRLKR
ncbi:MAG: RecX family transcriptional regulator, partial [Firmicutes bacterium]|nr:RecX family transcriptional regulator [Bacillota bacterium]